MAKKSKFQVGDEVKVKEDLRLEAGPTIEAGSAGIVARKIRSGSKVVAVLFRGVKTLGSGADLTVKVSVDKIEKSCE